MARKMTVTDWCSLTEGFVGALEREAAADPRQRDSLPIAMLGVAFDSLRTADALARIERMIHSRQPHHVVTANVDFLVQARQDAHLRRILREAHLVLCDGTPLVWASRWLGNPLPERVAGSDLVPQLIERAVECGYSFYLLGGLPGVNARAVARLREQHPGLNIAGHYSPPFKPLADMDHDEIIRRIRGARPDILLVSLGCPKAEKWIARHYRSLGVPVVMGVGATIDFLAGEFRRAPKWMQRCGAEWLFRLVQEPRRLAGRYARDLWHFTRDMGAQWWRLRCLAPRRQERFPHWRTLFAQGWMRVDPGPRLDHGTIARHQAFWEQLQDDDRHCLLDVRDVRFIDSTGVAVLMRLRRQLADAGRALVLIAPAAAVRRTLAAMQLEDHFLVAANALEARRLIREQELARREPQWSESAPGLEWEPWTARAPVAGQSPSVPYIPPLAGLGEGVCQVGADLRATLPLSEPSALDPEFIRSS
jgi:N-acetylglucosaminyldiphosphoundecaprenol N-acetyl-beta-D-mannosaminyltransferase